MAMMQANSRMELMLPESRAGRRDHFYLCFTPDHDIEQAIRRFIARYGRLPAETRYARSGLRLGPVPSSVGGQPSSVGGQLTMEF